MTLASTSTPSSAPSSLSLFTNRANRLFEQAAQQVRPQLSAATHHRFSYWATFYGENPDAQDSDIQLIERSISNLVESKGWVARKVPERGLEDLFPPSYFSVADACACGENIPLWFSKPVHLSGGRGIECVRNADLASYQLPQHHILQAGVQNLMLLDSRKFTGRVYVLVWNQQLYLYHDGFILLHGVPFDPLSTDYTVHVDHAGYQSDNSPVEMRLISSQPEVQAQWQNLQQATQRLSPLFDELRDASSQNRYIMLGIDFLLQNDGGLQFIEVNAIPNFIHSDLINRQLNVPFFADSIRLMLGLEAPGLMSLS